MTPLHLPAIIAECSYYSRRERGNRLSNWTLDDFKRFTESRHGHFIVFFSYIE